MFRRSLLPFACLGVALGIAVCAAPVPAWTQDLSTQERLDRLERDLNMLQRQVYQGAPTSTTAMGGGGAPAVNEEIRLERLEAQMRDLTGRVEEYANQVQQLRQRLEQINSDIDVRFQQLGAGGGAAASGGPAPSPPRQQTDAAGFGDENAQFSGDEPPAPSADRAPPGAAGPGPAPIFGTLTPPGEGPPRPPPPRFASTAPPARPDAAAGGGGSPRQQYDYAFGLLKQANYPGAEAALKAFLQQHPHDPMAGSAQYWLGDLYLTQRKYMQAAGTFADGYRRYPRGAKAPEELLKLGVALGHADRKQDACVALAQLDRSFPHPGAAIKQRAMAEKKHLGCG